MNDKAETAVGGEKVRRRWPRRVLVAVLLTFFALVGLVSLLPTLVGTGAGRRFVVGQINGRIPGSVQIDGLSVGWRGGQRLSGVRLQDPDGAVVLTLDELALPDVGLLGVARGSLNFGEVTLAGLKADLRREADGRTNLEHAVAPAGAARDPGESGETKPESSSDESGGGGGLPEGLRALVELRDVEVIWREAEREPLGLSITSGAMKVDGGVSGQLDARLTVGAAEGTVAGEVSGGMGADAPWDATLAVTGLPLPAIDTWLMADGYVTATLGDAADFRVKLKQWSAGAGGGIGVEVMSGAGTGGTIELVDDGDTLRLAQPATFSLVQTPGLSEKVTRLVNPILMPAVISAVAPLKVTVAPDGFSLPSRGFDWTQVNAVIHLDVGRVTAQASRPPFDQIVKQLQAFNVLKEGSLYEMDVRPIDLTIDAGVFNYAPQIFDIDDVTLTFSGQLSVAEGQMDVRLVPGGREIDRDPVLRSLTAQGVRIAGPLDAPVVNFGSVLDGLKQDRIGDTLTNVLGGLLERELQKKQDKKNKK